MERFGYVAIVDDDASTREALARLLRAPDRFPQLFFSSRFSRRAPLRHAGSPDRRCEHALHDGLELQRELFNLCVRIPTVVITASDDERVAASAASLGAAALVLKPVGRDALMAAIHYAAKKHSGAISLSTANRNGLAAQGDH